MNLHLHGLGHFHPENEITNAFLQSLEIGTSDEWIMERVGIRSRRTALPLDYILETRNRDPRAAMEAAKQRFRPILMTAFSFILGVLPLLVASGAGAEARKVMGMTVFSGMLVATIVGVLVVPGMYVIVERYISRGKSKPELGGAS